MDSSSVAPAVVELTYIIKLLLFTPNNKKLLHLWARWSATSPTNATIITFVGVITFVVVTGRGEALSGSCT